MLLGTGASTLEDVEPRPRATCAAAPGVVLMQCNTNYTGDEANLGYVNLRVLAAATPSASRRRCSGCPTTRRAT